MKATLILELVFCTVFKTALNPCGLRLRTGPESAATLTELECGLNEDPSDKCEKLSSPS